MARRKTTEEFIAESNFIHNNKYSYNTAMYVNAFTKVIITCPVHGNWEQIPHNHLAGRGCPGCAGQAKRSTEEFTIRANQIHGNRYYYNKTVFINVKTKITIICPIHGDFEQEANVHLKGCGCPSCGGRSKSNTEESILKAGVIHDSKYRYDKTVYVKAKTKVVITCPLHGDFEQAPYSHLSGNGCPSCAASGFDINKPAYLYYLKIITEESQVLYKIGITNRTVEARFNLTDLSKIEIIKQKLYENGSEALEWETKLKRMCKQYQYKGPDVLSSGNTELCTEDVWHIYNQALHDG